MDSDCEDLGVAEQIACAQGPIHNHGLPKLPAAMHSSTKTAACAGGLLHRHVPPTMMPGIKSTIRHRHSSSPSLAGTKAPWQRMWKGLLPPPRITPLPTLGDYLPRRPSRAHGRDLAHGGDPVPGSRDGYGRCAYDGGRDPNPALFQISNQRYGCTNHDATGPGPHLRTELDPPSEDRLRLSWESTWPRVGAFIALIDASSIYSPSTPKPPDLVTPAPSPTETS